MSYCTYITVHQPTGRFYIGKARTCRIKHGYKGSGEKLRRVFMKYPKTQWDTGILWEFETSDEAYSDEGGLIDEELLKDPLCMNVCQGGHGSPGHPRAPAVSAQHSEFMKGWVKTPEGAAHIQSMHEMRWSDPGASEHLSKQLKSYAATPEGQAHLSRAGKLSNGGKKGGKANRRPCTLDFGVTVFESQTAMVREVGQTKPKSPNFRWVLKSGELVTRSEWKHHK